MAKLAQSFDATICNLLSGQLPTTTSLMDALGREGCPESEVLKAAGAAPPGQPPLTNEDYAGLANTISNAGSETDMKLALTGNPNQTYLSNVAKAIEAQSPAFSDHLSDPDSVANFCNGFWFTFLRPDAGFRR